MCAGNIDSDTSKTGGVDVSEREPLSVEAAQQLLIEGQSLPVEGNLLAALQHSLDLVQDWESRLAEVGKRQVHILNLQFLVQVLTCSQLACVMHSLARITIYCITSHAFKLLIQILTSIQQI